MYGARRGQRERGSASDRRLPAGAHAGDANCGRSGARPPAGAAAVRKRRSATESGGGRGQSMVKTRRIIVQIGTGCGLNFQVRMVPMID